MQMFLTLRASGRATAPKVGDRLVYDRKNGTLLIDRLDDGPLTLGAPDGPAERVFVGRDWTEAQTQATAELYARVGGLHGVVERVEGSFPTLWTYVVAA